MLCHGLYLFPRAVSPVARWKQAVMEFFLCLAHSQAAFLQLAADEELHPLLLGGMAASAVLSGVQLPWPGLRCGRQAPAACS